MTPEIQKITVNASPTAVSLFQALGFRAESEERFDVVKQNCNTST
ncbi:MAG: GNAT family N-acetyltransferase [Firmicutes bacterium]|nr:GNAT family N-acetyltransferase [Bacillota bacterium]